MDSRCVHRGVLPHRHRVGPSFTEGGLLSGTLITLWVAGVFTAVLWVVYGFVRSRTDFPVARVMIMAGFLCPVAVPIAVLGPLWIIGHVFN